MRQRYSSFCCETTTSTAMDGSDGEWEVVRTRRGQSAKIQQVRGVGVWQRRRSACRDQTITLPARDGWQLADWHMAALKHRTCLMRVCHMPRQALKRAAIPVVPLAFGALSPYQGEAAAAKKKKKEKRKVGAMPSTLLHLSAAAVLSSAGCLTGPHAPTCDEPRHPQQ